MEEENLQNEKTPKGSLQEHEDKEDHPLQTPEWYRSDSKRQDPKVWKNMPEKEKNCLKN